jgi:hypothetical protein
MPAINSDVPIGYRMNGDEMLSFMPSSRQQLAHLFPSAGSRARKPKHGRAFSSPWSGASPQQRPPFEAEHSRKARRFANGNAAEIIRPSF